MSLNKKIIETYQRKLQHTLDKTLKKEYPKLDTEKITHFHTKILKTFLTITSTIIFIGTFTWYFPKKIGLTYQTITTILLCIIILSIQPIKEAYEQP